MDSLDYWRLCEELSLIEAGLLIAGKDPSGKDSDSENWAIPQRPFGYEAAKNAVARALERGEIKGKLIWKTEKDIDENTNCSLEGTVDPGKSSVEVESLRTWLRGKGFTAGFFFSNSSDIPPYLDSNNPSYSTKLAAAVRSWEAVTTDPKYLDNGRHVKQNLENWLTAHAAEYDLIKANGDINKDAIKNQIAKVSNWKDRGGAPKTPTAKPPPPKDF